jgi:hypothetical protein
VQGVVLALAKSLPAWGPTDLVVWDEQACGLRYADAWELNALFGSCGPPEGVALRQDARQVGRPFVAGLEDLQHTWLLDAELAYQGPGGVQAMARRTSQLALAGVRTAAIVHDLIPIQNPAYGADRDAHLDYVAELVRTDLILANSQYTADAFARLWQDQGLTGARPILACPLPDGGFGPQRASPPAASPHLVMLGSVEPRKRQLQAVQAFAAAQRRSAAVAGARLTVIGDLHPAVAAPFRRLVAATPGVVYLNYAPDAVRDAALATATATLFASDDEGFGLPIAESLAAGLPCLCADFGAMAELVKGGGCLGVDVRDQGALEAGVIALCEDQGLIRRLKDEIAGRAFRTWRDYAGDLVAALVAAGAARPDAAPRAGRPDVEVAYAKACKRAGAVRLRLILSSDQVNQAETMIRSLLRHISTPSRAVQLLVLDRGSSLTRLAALSGLSHPNLRLHVTSADLGEVAALQVAARLMGADYIWSLAPTHEPSASDILNALAQVVSSPGAPALPLKAPMQTQPGLPPVIWRQDVFAAALDIAITGDPVRDLAALQPQARRALERLTDRVALISGAV